MKEARPMPDEKAEDETAIVARPEYDRASDVIWGYCGKKRPDHKCGENYLIPVANDQGAYDRLVLAMSESKLAPYARVIMVDPLHKDLPEMVLHLQPTCNCFDHNFVLHQWLLFDRPTETFLDLILGPDVGKASDADSCRRKLHLSQ